ncbi:MAG: hypothetical protein U9P71_04295 [Campylobacterota bacterium]|nr:hypothetical protein [Campylobacterota bacterium]
MTPKKGLFLGFLFAFLVLGFVAMQRAMPDAKEERIYKAIKVYSPYKLEKITGGLAIIDSRTGEKEKPSAAEVLHRYDELDKEWGVKHLRVESGHVVVMGENNQSVVKIFIETEKERAFLQQFFGI